MVACTGTSWPSRSTSGQPSLHADRADHAACCRPSPHASLTHIEPLGSSDAAGRRRARRAPHAPRRLGRVGHHVEPGPRAGHRAPRQGLLGVRRARHRVRPARRREPRRARRDLPLDRADPVVAAGRRAVCPRRDRRRVPLAAHHHARAPVQPDEAQPRRRARPRPHHPRCDPGARPGEPRVPAGARRADPDDGPHVRPAAERGHRREGNAVGEPRRRRCRHRGAATRGAPLRLHRHRLDGRDRTSGGARRHDPRRRGRRDGRRGDRRGGRVAPSRPHRPRDPGSARSGADAPRPRGERHARDLPDVEPADARAP